MSMGTRTYASMAEVLAAYGQECTYRYEELADRRLLQLSGRYGWVFESLQYGDGCWAAYLRIGRKWPATLARECAA